MSKMMEYISGQADGEVARLEASLEHMGGHLEIEIEDNQKLRAEVDRLKAELAAADSRSSKMVEALRLARPIIEGWMHVDMCSNTLLEKTERPGAVLDGDFWHHPDTLDHPDAKKAYEEHTRCLALIDAALTGAGEK